MMRLPVAVAPFCLLVSSAVAAGQAPPVDALYSTAPSKELLKSLHDQLSAAPSATGLDRIRRVELAARIIQLDLVLGEEGSKRYTNSTIRPARALEALDALQALDPVALDNLKSADTRRVLWDAIASAHPAYHLYVDAVRLAGQEDDAEVLERTLKVLVSSWSKGSRSRPLVEIHQPIGLWGRNVLCDCLRMQAIRDAEGALKLTAGLRTIPESVTRRQRAVGNPPVMSTRPLPQLAGSGKLTDFERILHLAAALQRAGHAVTFWSIAAERTLNATTKTIAQEPIVIYPEEAGKPTLIALGADEVLGKLKGEEIVPHIYRFTAPEALEGLLMNRVQYRVIMSEVLEANASPTVWANAMQRFLATRTGAANPRDLLLDLANLDPMAGFAKAAAESLADVAQPSFLKFVDAHSIRLSVTKIKNEKAESAVSIRDLNDRDKELVLPAHEAVLGRALQVLPAKFLENVQSISLQTEPLKEKLPTGIRQGSRIVVRDVETPLNSRGWSDRFMLAKPQFAACIHELTHCWALSRREKFKIDDWEGTLIDAFNEISWQRADDKWAIRGGTAQANDFVAANGAANEHEDLAVESEHYVVQSRFLRDIVRVQLYRGNFAPAAKYLFAKQIAFLDADGKCIEFENDFLDQPFTRAEFEKAVKELEVRKPLTDEQKRLSGLVNRFFALAEEMVKSGRIVRGQ
jgi:hypothetical protein